MQAYLLGLFFASMCGEYLVALLGLPPLLRFVPEVMSLLLLVYVVFAGTRDRFRLVAAKYWIAFVALGVIILCGIANSPSGAGAMLGGLRFFLRAVPLFFLPAVLPQTDSQIRRQLQLLVLLCLVQLPVTAYQRWVTYEAEHFSGDGVRGTVLDSGFLSMILICSVAVLTGLLFKRRIGKLTYACLFLVLLLPTTINETKGTVVFLPVCLFVTLIAGSEPQKRLQYVLMGLAAMIVFGALFVPIYNKMEEFNPYAKERDITNYFTDEKNLDRYMSSNIKGVGAKQAGVRRGDAILVPLQYLGKDPVMLAFGLGLGSVSSANFGKNFEGDYYGIFQQFLITSFTFLAIEVGIFGLAVIAVLLWMVFMDSLVVSRRDDSLIGAIAAGWTGVVALIGVGLFYNQVHESTAITFLFAYFSGLICARRVSLSHGG